MTDVLEIEKAISKPPPKSCVRLLDWRNPIGSDDPERDAMTAATCVARLLDEEEGREDPFAEG